MTDIKNLEDLDNRVDIMEVNAQELVSMYDGYYTDFSIDEIRVFDLLVKFQIPFFIIVNSKEALMNELNEIMDYADKDLDDLVVYQLGTSYIVSPKKGGQ